MLDSVPFWVIGLAAVGLLILLLDFLTRKNQRRVGIVTTLFERTEIVLLAIVGVAVVMAIQLCIWLGGM